jgi:uncharacterized protein
VASLKPLLELQRCDTALLQLKHHLATLTERTNLTAATTVLNGFNKELVAVRAQLKVAQHDIELLEIDNKKCESSITRYGQQLKTIIAPREAEALQHEITMATAVRSANDDKELELLEVAEQFDRQQAELNNQIIKQDEVIEQATRALALAIEQCEQSKLELEAKRVTLSALITPELIKLYDLKKNRRTTPAVADLHSATCQSCHLDLSTVELSALKKCPDGEIPECPNCDCYLVV